jgi:hypothetical protein
MAIRKPQDPERHALVTEVMSLDSVAAAEHLTGKSVDVNEASRVLGLGIQINKSSLLRKMQIEAGDFVFSDTWIRRKAILERCGFKPMFAEGYIYRQRSARLEIWLEQKHGLVFVQNICVDEEGVERPLDHGRCDFSWMVHNGEDKYQAIAGMQLSGGWESVKYPNWRTMESPDPKQMFFRPDDLYFRGYVEGNGMIHKLQYLLIKGQYINPWPTWEPGKYPLATWYTTPAEYDEDDLHPKRSPWDRLAAHSKKNIERFESFPEELQRVINVKPVWRNKK